MFERFTEKAIKAIMLAQEEARRLGLNPVGDRADSSGSYWRRHCGFVAVVIPFTPRAKRALELSLEEARRLGHNYIGPEHLFLGLLRKGEGVAARVLENLGADPGDIRMQASEHSGESAEAVGAGVGGGSGGNKMPTLEGCGTNLTKLAAEGVLFKFLFHLLWGKLDPVFGRQQQIERVVRILGCRTKNNPCLIGEPGVGKTAIAEGLARRVASGDVPETIEGKKRLVSGMLCGAEISVQQTTLSDLVVRGLVQRCCAGTYEVEERWSSLEH
ncbi:hypothetical protein NL676_009722 [Syzygium grande]|nr:hypothetical protein NL676_009722 [Syzygium grande]